MTISVAAVLGTALSLFIVTMLGALGYLVKRLINNSDDNHKALVKTLTDINDKNSEQHREFYKNIQSLEVQFAKLRAEHDKNHPRC